MGAKKVQCLGLLLRIAKKQRFGFISGFLDKAIG